MTIRHILLGAQGERKPVRLVAQADDRVMTSYEGERHERSTRRARARTGQYAGIVGKGRNGHAGLVSAWYARYESFLTAP